MVTALTVNLDTIKTKANEERLPNYNLGGSNVISVDHFRSVIIPGDSLDFRETLRIQREQETARREIKGRTTIAREGRAEGKPSPSYKTNQGYEVIGYSNEQCVAYSKRMSGITRSIGYAGTARADGTDVQVGAIGLMRDWGHAVYIEAVEGDTVTVSDSNWVKGSIIRRKLSTSEIRGYIYK